MPARLDEHDLQTFSVPSGQQSTSPPPLCIVKSSRLSQLVFWQWHRHIDIGIGIGIGIGKYNSEVIRLTGQPTSRTLTWSWAAQQFTVLTHMFLFSSCLKLLLGPEEESILRPAPWLPVCPRRCNLTSFDVEFGGDERPWQSYRWIWGGGGGNR